MSTFSFSVSADKINNIVAYMRDAAKILGTYKEDLEEVNKMLGGLPGLDFGNVSNACRVLNTKIRKAEELKKNCEAFAKSMEAFLAYAMRVDANAAFKICEISENRYKYDEFTDISKDTKALISTIVGDIDKKDVGYQDVGYLWSALLESIAANRRNREARAAYPFEDSLRDVLERQESELFRFRNAKEWSDDFMDHHYKLYLAKTWGLFAVEMYFLPVTSVYTVVEKGVLPGFSDLFDSAEQYIKYENLLKAERLRGEGHLIASEYFSEIKDLVSYDSHYDFGGKEANESSAYLRKTLKGLDAFTDFASSLMGVRHWNIARFFVTDTPKGELSESKELFKDIIDMVRGLGSSTEALVKIEDQYQSGSTDEYKYAKNIWKILKKTPVLNGWLEILKESDNPIIKDIKNMVDMGFKSRDFYNSANEPFEPAPENEFKAKMDKILSTDSRGKMRDLWNTVVVPKGQYDLADFSNMKSEEVLDIMAPLLTREEIASLLS